MGGSDSEEAGMKESIKAPHRTVLEETRVLNIETKHDDVHEEEEKKQVLTETQKKKVRSNVCTSHLDR